MSAPSRTIALAWSGCAKAGSELVCRCAKQRSEPSNDMRGFKADKLNLMRLEMIDSIAVLVPYRRA